MVRCPSYLKRAAKQAFTVPKLIHNKLIPPSDNSIHSMTEFTLPAQVVLIRTMATGLSKYLSITKPYPVTETMLMWLRRLPIPDTSTIRRLVEFSRQGWLDGLASVKYTHLSNDVKT